MLFFLDGRYVFLDVYVVWFFLLLDGLLDVFGVWLCNVFWLGLVNFFFIGYWWEIIFVFCFFFGWGGRLEGS